MSSYPNIVENKKAEIDSPFNRIAFQQDIASFFDNANRKGNLSHAYLLTGPSGAGKDECAMSIALACVCADGGCAKCEECKRVLKKTHPDVCWVEPEGTSYLVDQIRNITHQAILSPIRSKNKVFIISHADVLNAASANAFLKTLEEPSDSTYFILTAPTRESVLATISSRCQTIQFPSISTGDSVLELVKESGKSEKEAEIALALKGGSIGKALEFLGSKQRLEISKYALKAVDIAEKGSIYELLESCSNILSSIKAQCKDIDETYNKEVEEGGGFLSQGALKSLKEKQKRMKTSSEREMISEALDSIRYYLRNKMIRGFDCSDLAFDFNFESADKDCASGGKILTPEGFAIAQKAIDRAMEQIAHNVTPRLALNVMLLKVREVLHANRYFG